MHAEHLNMIEGNWNCTQKIGQDKYFIGIELIIYGRVKLKLDLKAIRCENMDCILVGRNMIQGGTLANTVMNL